MVPKSLICAPPIKFGLSFGRLRFDNKHLLVCELPFSLDDIALCLLIERRSRVHHDTLAAMLAISREWFAQWIFQPGAGVSRQFGPDELRPRGVKLRRAWLFKAFTL